MKRYLFYIHGHTIPFIWFYESDENNNSDQLLCIDIKNLYKIEELKND